MIINTMPENWNFTFENTGLWVTYDGLKAKLSSNYRSFKLYVEMNVRAMPDNGYSEINNDFSINNKPYKAMCEAALIFLKQNSKTV